MNTEEPKAEVERLSELLAKEGRHFDAVWQKGLDLQSELDMMRRALGAVREELRTELHRRQSDEAAYSVVVAQNATMQSELTRARELLMEAITFGKFDDDSIQVRALASMTHQSASAVQLFKNKGTGNWAVCELKDRIWSPVSPPFKHKLDAAKWLSDNQSAPAAKGPSGKCWSCCKPVTLAECQEADGECPHCRAEIQRAEDLKP